MNHLKQLPTAPTKKQAVEIYMKQGRTERQIRIQINAIIARNRNLSDKCIRLKNLLDVEFAELIKTFGVPIGYQKPDFFSQ